MMNFPVEVIAELCDGIVDPEVVEKVKKKIEVIQKFAPQQGTTQAIEYTAPNVDTTGFITKSALMEMASEIPDGIVPLEDTLKCAKSATMWEDFEREFDKRMGEENQPGGQLTDCLRRFIIYWNLDFRHEKIRAKDAEANNPRWTASLFQTIAITDDPILEISRFMKGEQT